MVGMAGAVCVGVSGVALADAPHAESNMDAITRALISVHLILVDMIFS